MYVYKRLHSSLCSRGIYLREMIRANLTVIVVVAIGIIISVGFVAISRAAIRSFDLVAFATVTAASVIPVATMSMVVVAITVAMRSLLDFMIFYQLFRCTECMK